VPAVLERHPAPKSRQVGEYGAAAEDVALREDQPSSWMAMAGG
jgi:hypothetical protein